MFSSCSSVDSAHTDHTVGDTHHNTTHKCTHCNHGPKIALLTKRKKPLREQKKPPSYTMSDLLDMWEEYSETATKKDSDLQVFCASFKETKLGSPAAADASHESSSEGSESPTPPKTKPKEVQEERAERLDEAQRKGIEHAMANHLTQLRFISGIHQEHCVCVYPGEDKEMNRGKFTRLYEDLSNGCMFYIGICAAPLWRWENPKCGHMHNSSSMHLLAYGRSMIVGDIEAFLIEHAWLHNSERCVNEQIGGCGQGTFGDFGFLYLCRKKRKAQQDEHNYIMSKVRRKFLKANAASSSRCAVQLAESGST